MVIILLVAIGDTELRGVSSPTELCDDNFNKNDQQTSNNNNNNNYYYYYYYYYRYGSHPSYGKVSSNVARYTTCIYACIHVHVLHHYCILVQVTMPHSFQVIIQLPPKQLEQLLQVCLFVCFIIIIFVVVIIE